MWYVRTLQSPIDVNYDLCYMEIKLRSENLLLYRRLAKTTINDMRGNREMKND